MNKNGKVVLALIAGAAAGLAAGLLFAPEKGKDTRKKIADSAKKIGEDALNKIKEMTKKGGKSEEAES
ncbi:MAG: YtxH domain-containing protein [Bacteroidota bacterium]|nr:YtxH domain-containing protein [Bacteroidota bacterium]